MDQRYHSSGWCLILAVIAAAASPASAGFTVIDLGVSNATPTMGATGTRYPNSGANGINAAGATAGALQSGPGVQVAVAGVAGGGFASIPLPTAATSGMASAIGATGEVVGSFVSVTDHQRHAFSSFQGKTTDLGPIPGGLNSQANGINGSGQIVGNGMTSTNVEQAYRISATGAYTMINPLVTGMANYAYGINTQGAVIGTSGVGAGYVHAYVLTATGTIDLAAGNNGAAFGANTQGMAINDNNYVVGYGDVGIYQHAFLGVAGGPLKDLGVSGSFTSSYAYALNAANQVVGSMDRGGGSQTAFGYAPGFGNGGPIDLNTLLDPADRTAWHLSSATGINDGDEICGQGLYNGGDARLRPDPRLGSRPRSCPSRRSPSPPRRPWRAWAWRSSGRGPGSGAGEPGAGQPPDQAPKFQGR